MANLTFNEVKEKHFERLEQFTPIVDRVHADNHPEFHDVKSTFDEMVSKINNGGGETPDLEQEFKELRRITDNYTVPGDVCETYEAVYNMLEQLDRSYKK